MKNKQKMGWVFRKKDKNMFGLNSLSWEPEEEKIKKGKNETK